MKIAFLPRFSAVAYTTALVVTASTQVWAQSAPSEQAEQPVSTLPAESTAPPVETPPGAAKPAEATPGAQPQHHTPPGPPPTENPKYFHATEVQYLYGRRYKEISNFPDSHYVQKHILTFQHYSEWALGRNFFFFDLLKSDSSDNDANEVYGEAYTSLSASKMLGRSLSASIFDDINITMGINAGAKSTGAAPFILLPGITTDWKIPGFTFFHVDVLAYIDQGRLAGRSNQCQPAGVQITPAWDAPFEIGPIRFDFQGFVDVITGHGACEYQVLTQPQLRIDVGNFFGKQDRIFIGTEVQYWVNKYGIKDLNEFNPQTLVVWRL